jgi:hypothetical protein
MCTLCDLFYLKNAKDIAVTWPNSPECCGLNGICFKATFLSFDLLKELCCFFGIFPRMKIHLSVKECFQFSQNSSFFQSLI